MRNVSIVAEKREKVNGGGKWPALEEGASLIFGGRGVIIGRILSLAREG